jgi:Asp-tRNA(Asn)/Glu-tRNA(Gln) amidotransferase A subunit family amidase
MLSRRELLLQCAAWFGSYTVSRQVSAADSPLQGTIADYQRGRVRGEWSAEEVVRSALDRSAAAGDRFRAIAVLAPDALDAARASDRRLLAGALRGPLDGVPVFAKSIYDMRGLPTDASNAEWKALFPNAVTRDALEVARLRDAGAVVLGKTAADDFAYKGEGNSTATGRVRNPYDRHDTRTSGGSSAGSAVVVAFSAAFGALGTDDGGSNRIPAQCCGVVGMKPTFGRIARSGVLPTWPVLDTHGPLARTAEDAALLFDVLAHPHATDPFGAPSGWSDSRGEPSLRGHRLGLVSAHVPRAQMSADAIHLFDRAVDDVRAAGATIVEIEPAVTLHTFRGAFTDASAGGVVPNARSPEATARALLRYFARRPGDPRAHFRRGYAAYQRFYDVLPTDPVEGLRLATGDPTAVPAAQAFLRARDVVVRQLATSMTNANVSALIYPTMPFAAFGADGVWPGIRTPLGFGNWLGLPEVSVPAGLGSDGIPGMSLSFIGRPMTDRAMLGLATAYERESHRFVSLP